jgi:hypothetical protein
LSIVYLSVICDYSEDLCKLQEKAEEEFLMKNYKQSLFNLLLACEMGSSHSTHNALYILETHQGLIENQSERIYELNQRLTNMGYKTNLVRMGDCYFYGKGVKQSFKDAFAFYLSASMNNSAEGCYSLSYMYEYGLGCEKSLKDAVKYAIKMSNTENNAYLLFWYLAVRLVFKILLNVFGDWRSIASIFLGFLSFYCLFKFKNWSCGGNLVVGASRG